MSNPILDNGLVALEFARRTTLTLVEEIPQDKFCHQPFAGANHPLWNLGHLAVTDDYFMNELAQRQRGCPEGWWQMFGMGSEPKASLGDYPPIQEVQEAMHQRREEFIGWFKSMDEKALSGPLPDQWKGFARSYGALMSTVGCHEAMHAGQITVIRKSLGMKPKFG